MRRPHRLRLVRIASAWAALGIGSALAQGNPARSEPSSATPLIGAAVVEQARSMPPGWREVPRSRFRDAMPSRTQTEWGTVGPAAALIAWNNVAFDGHALYAHGGGHTDYGGNEVYRFPLSTLKWERVTQPQRYPERKLTRADGTATAAKSAERCPPPLAGPPSTHTYDGKFVTGGKLWVATTGIAFCPSGVGEITHPGLWAWDVATLQWEASIAAPLTGLWLSAVLPNGHVFLANADTEIVYDPRTRATLERQGGYPDEGDGSAVYDARRNRIWVINRTGIAYIPLTPDFKLAGKRTRVAPRRSGDAAHPGGLSAASAFVVDPASGRLLGWNGRRHVVAYTPETDRWEAYDFPAGPSSQGALYDRMFPLPGADGAFIVVGNNADEDVWLLKLPPAAGTPVPMADLQSVIDRAAAGSRVTFAPGLYSTGVVIGKPLTVDFEGVAIASAAEAKAAVVVRDAKGVVIENLTACGLPGGGNIAAVKAEGLFDLTIRHLVSCDNEMGLLTDNRGGRLVIEDSRFENMGRPNSDLGHLIYVGEIDDFTLRRSVVRCSRNGGHLVKSRAARSLIERNLIAQTDCNTSRLIDLPAGGDNRIVDNVLQQGPRSQNAEMIGTGLETRARQWPAQATLLEGNLFISDLTKRPSNSIPAVFKTREGHTVTARQNRIVWSDGQALRGRLGYLPGGAWAEAGAANREFFNRAAAGLPPYPQLVPPP